MYVTALAAAVSVVAPVKAVVVARWMVKLASLLDLSVQFTRMAPPASAVAVAPEGAVGGLEAGVTLLDTTGTPVPMALMAATEIV